MMVVIRVVIKFPCWHQNDEGSSLVDGIVKGAGMGLAPWLNGVIVVEVPSKCQLFNFVPFNFYLIRTIASLAFFKNLEFN